MFGFLDAGMVLARHQQQKDLAVTLEYVVLVLDGGKHDKDVSIDITLYFTYVSLRHPALSD